MVSYGECEFVQVVAGCEGREEAGRWTIKWEPS